MKKTHFRYDGMYSNQPPNRSGTGSLVNLLLMARLKQIENFIRVLNSGEELGTHGLRL
jgi:hypothetical protein